MRERVKAPKNNTIPGRPLTRAPTENFGSKGESKSGADAYSKRVGTNGGAISVSHM